MLMTTVLQGKGNERNASRRPRQRFLEQEAAQIGLKGYRDFKNTTINRTT